MSTNAAFLFALFFSLSGANSLPHAGRHRRLCATVAAASAAARPVEHRAHRAHRPPPKSGLDRNRTTAHFSEVHKDAAAVSGSSFLGAPERLFDDVFEPSRDIESRRGYLASLLAANPPPTKLCRKWAVLTTIFRPGPAIDRLLEGPAADDGWCLVVVADKKTPPRTEYPPGIVYISYKDQERWTKSLHVMQWIPYNNYARKNLGYLYAVAQQAEAIFDADDDNALFPNATVPVRDPNDPGHVTQAGSILGAKLFNPYPHFGGTVNDTWWPRGFPINQVTDRHTRPIWHPYFKPGADESFVVQQGLANIDPDVDAVFRMTRSQRRIIWDDTKWPVYPPAGVLTPYNAQATVFSDGGFWSLMLPATVHGRVADIWRSYWAQRLMWDVGQRVLFVPPFVEHNRTAHNFFDDFNAESQLYDQAHALVELLSTWDGSVHGAVTDNLPNRARALAIWMYERGFWEINDVHLTHAWFQDLEMLGYNFPSVLSNTGPFQNGLRQQTRDNAMDKGCVAVLVDERQLGEVGKYVASLASAPFVGSEATPLLLFVQAAGRSALDSILFEQLPKVGRPTNYRVVEIDDYHFHAPPREVASSASNLTYFNIDSSQHITQSAGYTWCSQFLAHDMFMHPLLREYKYVWRMDQDTYFKPCDGLTVESTAKCEMFLKEGPFKYMRNHNFTALDIQAGEYSTEAPFVIEQLRERASSFVEKRPTMWDTESTVASISNWDRHLIAGFSETYDQFKLFQNENYYDFLHETDAMSSGIWSLFWREQAFKTLWMVISVDKHAIGNASEVFYPTLKHKTDDS